MGRFCKNNLKKYDKTGLLHFRIHQRINSLSLKSVSKLYEKNETDLRLGMILSIVHSYKSLKKSTFSVSKRVQTV